MKAIVLTFDRHRAITQHMILQYKRVWPDHPFCFRIPYQNLGGINSDQLQYLRTPGETPEDIPAAVLELLADLPLYERRHGICPEAAGIGREHDSLADPVEL